MSILDVTVAGADPHGASACDDVIKHLLQQATPGGGTLYFPAGYYLFNQPIHIEAYIRLLGDGPFASTIISSADPAVVITNANPQVVRGAGLTDIGVATKPAPRTAVRIYSCALAVLSNVRLETPFDGLYVERSSVDVRGLYVLDHTRAAVRLVDCGGDNFLSQVHSNTNIPDTNIGGIVGPIGAWLSNAGGAQFTDCDFIKGRCGVLLDDLTNDPQGSNDWVKFTSVSADTTTLDPWHIQQARGLQLINCWSGSFPNGSGIWTGPKAKDVTLVNHQFRGGLIAINNNSDSMVVMGGIIRSVNTSWNSSVPGWPKLVDILGLSF